MTPLLKIRLKAFLIHFLLGFCLITLIIGGMVFWFFPYPFIAIDDISNALLVLICVDMTLGPLMTFLLYKPGKKGLWFDMSCIICLQVLALSYGIWAIYDSRPAYLIFYGDSFYLADHKRIDQTALTDPALSVGAFSRPRLIAAIIPGTPEEKFVLARESMERGIPVHFNAQYFHPINELDQQTATRFALKFSAYKTRIPEQFHDTSRFALFHIMSYSGNKLAIVNLQDRQIVDVINLSP